MTQVQEPQEIAFHLQDAQSLYERDFALWLETTTALLRAKQFEQIDLENLIEEIESMGKSEKSAVRSNLTVVLMHLLKWKYQAGKRTNSWQSSIFEHRVRLDDEFMDSPSLKRYYLEFFAKCYQVARKQAAIETGLNLSTFPVESPFTPEQVLDSEFLP